MSEVKQIGNYRQGGAWDNPQTGRVYSPDGLSPTLNTCGGGDREPKIITAEVKKIFDIPTEVINDNERQRRVYDTEGISPSILSRQDSPKILQVGNINPNETGQSGNVYDSDGISPTLDTCQGGNRMPKIVEQTPCKLDKMPNGHLTSLDNARICDINTPTASTITARYYKGIGAHKDNMVLEPTVKIKQATQQGYAECKLGGVADLSYPTSKTRRGRVQDNGDTCPTLTASETGICRIETHYRIRKLTPRECWRLMDFADEDYEKAEAVNSNTQLYKQAGNSIVRAVLMAIFKQMLVSK